MESGELWISETWKSEYNVSFWNLESVSWSAAETYWSLGEESVLNWRFNWKSGRKKEVAEKEETALFCSLKANAQYPKPYKSVTNTHSDKLQMLFPSKEIILFWQRYAFRKNSFTKKSHQHHYPNSKHHSDTVA